MRDLINILSFPFSNSKSIINALTYLKFKTNLIENKNELINSKKLVIPGVGTFKNAMSYLKKNDYGNIIKDKIDNGDKILCICLGMQILFESSSEFGKTNGLGIIKGSVKKLPNINLGWREVLKQNNRNFYAYFVHSYYVEPVEFFILC